MKKFNKTISIEVSVDAIAQQFLATIAPDFKHREMLAEATIGAALEADNIGYIYNALNGYTAEINFKVGDAVMCSEKNYTYINGEQKYVEIGEAKVLEVNLYTKNKLRVGFMETRKDGTSVPETQWVSHKNCSHVPLAELEAAH